MFVWVGLVECVGYCLVDFFGGQWQCVVIVCVLVGELVLIFVDELIGNFDVSIVKEVLELFFIFNCECQVILVVVIYDFSLVVCFGC